jgi:hypothetical protein
LVRSNDPEIWLLLEREIALVKDWIKTGELDRRKEWNMKKLVYGVRRRRQAAALLTAQRHNRPRVTKRGMQS